MNTRSGDGSIVSDEKRAGQEPAPAPVQPAPRPSLEDEAATGEKITVIAQAAELAGKPLAPAGTARSNVHVPADLHDLIAGIPITPEEAQVLRHRRQLNTTIHGLLIVGLAVSTFIMLFGLVLDVILHRKVPSDVTRFDEVATRIRSFRPSGFLSLGLLVLIATPILRVVGSFAAFVHERDWRYAGITFLVLMILAISVMSGRG